MKGADALPDGLIVVTCAAGFLSQWEAVDRWSSVGFVWFFLVGGVLLLIRWLAVEAWHAAQDWQSMGPPGLGLRRRRPREEVER